MPSPTRHLLLATLLVAGGRALHAAPAAIGDAYAPVADAHVIQGPKTEKLNYGDRPVIIIKGERNASYVHRSFLRFDLAAHVGTVRGARLRLFIQRMDKPDPRSPTKIHLHTVADNAWREADLTWLTQPQVGPVIASKEVPAEGGTVEFDIGEAVVSALREGSSFSFALTQTKANQLVLFHSRETTQLGSEPLLYIQP